MSKDQLLAEILNLPKEERRALIEEAAASLHADSDMTPELRALIEERLADCRDHPEKESSWEDVSARLLSRGKQPK